MATPANTPSISEQILTRLTAVEIDIAVIKSNYATREDIAKTHVMIAETHALIAQVEARLIRWFVATAVALAGVSGSLAFLAAKFIH
jgi:uncharacterized HAD superfamily protein